MGSASHAWVLVSCNSVPFLAFYLSSNVILFVTYILYFCCSLLNKVVKPNQTIPNQIKSRKPNQTKPNQTKPNQTSNTNPVPRPHTLRGAQIAEISLQYINLELKYCKISIFEQYLFKIEYYIQLANLSIQI